VVVFACTVAAFSLIPHQSSVALAVPPGHPASSATYTCGPLWGSDYIHGPAETPFPVTGSPCSASVRTQDQIMTIIDMALSIGALFAIVTMGEHAAMRRLLASR
jgi:hypothetical protein